MLRDLSSCCAGAPATKKPQYTSHQGQDSGEGRRGIRVCWIACPRLTQNRRSNKGIGDLSAEPPRTERHRGQYQECEPGPAATKKQPATSQHQRGDPHASNGRLFVHHLKEHRRKHLWASRVGEGRGASVAARRDQGQGDGAGAQDFIRPKAWTAPRPRSRVSGPAAELTARTWDSERQAALPPAAHDAATPAARTSHRRRAAGCLSPSAGPGGDHGPRPGSPPGGATAGDEPGGRG